MRKAALSERQWTWIAVAAIAIGLVLRLVWVLVLHPPFEHVYSDMSWYLTLATNLVETGSLNPYDALHPPGTNLVLAAPLALFGTGSAGLWAAAVLWALLSSLTPFFMWRLARGFFSPAAAALTAVFTATWPLFITSAGFFLSETPSLTFLVGALWAGYAAERSTSRRAVALGALAGVLGVAAIATRPQFLLNVLVLVVPWVWAWRRKFRPLLAFAAAGAVIGAAVVTHNSLAVGEPTGVSRSTGFIFFMGHCDVLWVTSGTPPGPVFQYAAPPAVQRNTGRNYNFPDHLLWEQGFFFDQGLDCIRKDGIGHVRILGRSLLDMTSTTVMWPQANEDNLKEVVHYANVLYSLLLPVILVASIGRIFERRRSGKAAGGEIAMLVQLLCGFVLALLFFGDPRYRMQYDVFGFALLSVLIAAWLFDSKRTARPTTTMP